MEKFYQRTELLLGNENIQVLQNKKVAIFGIGGVGSYVLEALARVGIGEFILVDKDVVDVTNINRQIIALNSTIGQSKVGVAKNRILDINPDIKVTIHQKFYLPENEDEIDFNDCDYIIDAIDTVTAKIGLVMLANRKNIPIISSLGTGNKLNPTDLMVSDIYQTSICPLAKVMRKELKKRNVDKLKVVYSKENPIINRRPPASISFVPSVAGLIIASEVVKDLVGWRR